MVFLDIELVECLGDLRSKRYVGNKVISDAPLHQLNVNAKTFALGTELKNRMIEKTTTTNKDSRLEFGHSSLDSTST